MVAAGFIVEQSILGTVSFVLFVVYCLQLKQDIHIENVVNLQTGTSTIVFRRTKSLGYTAYIFHLGGVIGCFILILRSIDPFPVLGIYPFVATDLLSHVGIAVLLSTIFEGLGSMASKLYFKLNLPVNENFLQKWIRVITYCTFAAAVITWIIENFVSDKLMYSAGVYFIYGTIIQWIILFMYMRMIQVFQLQLNSTPLLRQNSSVVKSIKKLITVRNLFMLINILLTSYQIYVFAIQVRDQSKLDPIDPDDYSPILAPLYLTQVIGYTILLWFSYVSKSKAGEQQGLSEVSATDLRANAVPIALIQKRDEERNQMNQVIRPSQPNREVQKIQEVQEVVVKFKPHEMDPKMKVLDTEELQHTTINRQVSNTSENSQNLQNIYETYQSYPTDTFRSEVSSDPSGPVSPDELRRLMRLIEQQTEAEKEGRLDEFIAEQERIAAVRNTTTDTPGNDADYLVQQIQAMKERDRYERIRAGQPQTRRVFDINSLSSNGCSVPPSPPPFHPEEYTQQPDATTRVLFAIPDEGYYSSASDLDLVKPKHSKPKK